MPGLTFGTKGLICALLLTAVPVFCQQNLPDSPVPKPQATQQQQGVPDAPQPKAQDSNQFPGDAPPAPKNVHPDLPEAASTPTPQAMHPTPQSGVASGRDDLFKMTIAVNFVQLPVRVRDSSGKLVAGLGPNDFRVYEDGVPQQLKFFSVDPFPISAAIVVDTDLPAGTMKKVNETFPALWGAV